MYPRKTLDIGWRHLAYAMAACVWPGRRWPVARALERHWSPDGDALACLSVRTGFDLLLTALDLPRGSEVLVSAVTIRDMVRIIEEHGLVPVPVDLDMARLSIRPEALEKALSSRTRLVLVAHLFGSRMPLSEVAAFARRHDLLLLEDCAQAFTDGSYRGHAESDAVFFSFGPIKTLTALGGALVRVRDGALRGRMRSQQEGLPVRSRAWFACRTVKYVCITLLLNRVGLRLLELVGRLRGTTHDDLLSGAVRGFAGGRFFETIRHRPPYPLLALLRWRLRTLDPGRIRARAERGQTASGLMPNLERPGSLAPNHTYWVFPACPRHPDELMKRLWRSGFDATRGASSLGVVSAPPSRPDLAPREAEETMRRVVYLPVHPRLPERALLRLAREVAAGAR